MNKPYRIVAFLMLVVLIGGSLAACAPAQQTPKVLDKVTWVSPRGTLEVMDDWNMWSAINQGYCQELGINVDMQPGPADSLAPTKLVAEKQADVGYPSPGVLSSSIDSGIPVILAWEMFPRQVFDFAVAKGSPIKSVKDLAGKTISIWAPGGDVVVNPILMEAGVDPKSVNYVVGGPQWGAVVAQGKADAALAWRGLAAQWDAQGLALDYLVGRNFSKHPSNGYAIRKEDLNDPKKVDMWNRFFKCVAMGLEFGRVNPRAAAQITYDKFPALKEQMTPQLAFNSMWQLGCGYFDAYYDGKGYGYSYLDNWQSYLDAVYKLGQTKTDLQVKDVATNQFVAEANKIDAARVKKDAENFQLRDEWKAVQVPTECK